MNKLLILLLTLSPLVQGYDFFHSEKSYSTETATLKISKEYGFQFDLTAILIAAKDGTHPHYIEQWKQLDKIDAELLQLIYVTSKVRSISKSGYYTSSETAEKILNGSEFRIIIISPNGSELLNKEAVMTGAEIEHLVQSHNKALKLRTQ